MLLLNYSLKEKTSLSEDNKKKNFEETLTVTMVWKATSELVYIHPRSSDKNDKVYSNE